MTPPERFRTKVSPNGRVRKVPLAACPRCGQDVDLKGRKRADGETELVFKSHYDDVSAAPVRPPA
jgi:hypothetical protein